MKELVIKALHDYILIAIAAHLNKLNKKEAEDKQVKILEGIETQFTEAFTVEKFNAIVTRVKDDIDKRYYTEDKEAHIIGLITNFLVENKILDIDKAKTHVNRLWEYLSDKEGNYTVETLVFTLKDIYAVEIEIFLASAIEKAKVRIESEEAQEKIKQSLSDSVKREEENLKQLSVITEEARQEEENSDTMMQKVMLYTIATKHSELINRIMNYVCLLAYPNYPNEEKDAICYTLAGNTQYLKVLLSYELVNTYLSCQFRNIKEDPKFLDDLKAQGYNAFVDLLRSKSLESATNYIIQKLAGCMKDVNDIPKGINQIKAALENKLTKFNPQRQDFTVKRQESQTLVFYDASQVNTDPALQAMDELAFQKAKQARKDAEEIYGGAAAYNEIIRKRNEKNKIKKLVSITGSNIEEVENYHAEDDYGEIQYDLKGVVQDIMDFYTRIFDLTVKMQRFTGIYMFKDNNNTDSEHGVMELVISPSGEAQLRTIQRKSSSLLKWLRDDYEYPIRDKLKVARHNQVPSLENIMVNGYNYYPVFVARYAMGFVSGKKYSDFKSFLKAVKLDLENRLYKIYKEKVNIDGKEFEGSELFDASSPYRVNLIGAFVNSILFLTGNSEENFDSAQIRCVSAYPHTNDATYYTKFETTGNVTKGLSDAASVKFLEVNKSYPNNVIDITYIKDKEAFYNTISWAYQELGKVYSSGVIPQVAKNEPVVIGQELSGNLVEFTLGENNQFTTSIYAGSRSGKGVTTLSILGAIMASKIGICYLDCKPDMVNCFWEMEDRLAVNGLTGKTYAYDTNAGTPRLGKTVLESFQEIVPKKSKLYTMAVAESIFMLKQLQMIVLTGMYKQKMHNAETIVWVFDELNNMVSKMDTGFGTVLEVAKSKTSSEEDKQLALKIFDFWKRVQNSIGRGSADTWGQCGYKFICIGQKPQEIMDSKGQPKAALPDLKDCNASNGSDILKIIARAPANKYIVGRGLNINGGFGSKSLHNDKARSAEEKTALESYRYFLMRSDPQQNSGVETSDNTVVFKPFLTLNFDDALSGCWTGGVGKSVGGFDSSKMGTPEETSMLVAYKQAMNSAFGPNTSMSDAVLQDNKNGKGVVDEGTGFYGLVKMYLGGSDKEVLSTAIKPYVYFTKYLMEMDLLGDNSMYGHHTLEDFLYDFKEGPMRLGSLDEWNDVHDEWKAGESAEGGPSTDGEGNGLGQANFEIGDSTKTVPQAPVQQEVVVNTAQLDAEKRKADALNLVKQQQDRALSILQEVQGYGKNLDINIINAEIQKIRDYSTEMTTMITQLAGLATQNGLDFDSTLNGVNSTLSVLSRKQNELNNLRVQVESTQQLEEQQQTKEELEQELVSSLSQQEPIIEAINVDEQNKLADVSETAFTPDSTVDIDLRSYYVDSDYIKNVNTALDNLEGIYRKCKASKNTLKTEIYQNGVKQEEVTKLLATLSSLKQNIQDTIEPVYEKRNKLKDAIDLLESDLDNCDFEKLEKLEDYSSNFEGLREIDVLQSGIVELENEVLDLEHINDVMIGLITTYKAAKQYVDKLNQIIDGSKLSLNLSLVDADLQNLSSEIESFKLGCNQLLVHEGDKIPLLVQIRIDTLESDYKGIQNKLSQIQQAQQRTMEQQRQQEEATQSLLEQAGNDLSQDIVEQAQAVQEAQEQVQEAVQQQQTQQPVQQNINQGVGQTAEQTQPVNQNMGQGQNIVQQQRQQPVNQNIGQGMAQQQMQQPMNQDMLQDEDAIFDDSTGVDMTGFNDDQMAPQITNQGVQRIKADPGVKIQSGVEANATRVMDDGSAVVKSANYLEETIRDALPDLEIGRKKYSRIKFLDDAMITKNMRNQYKTIIRAIGEGVGWTDVTRLDLLSDKMVVNAKFNIPVQSLGDDGFDVYYAIDFPDLLLKRCIRLKYLILDQELVEKVVSECGGDIFELMFTNIKTLQMIQIGNNKVTRSSRDKSIEMAVQAEVERAQKRSRAKDAMNESLFASGKVKKTQKNMSIANKVMKRASKSGSKLGTKKGVMTAKRFMALTPMQGLAAIVGGAFIGVGTLLSKARGN